MAKISKNANLHAAKVNANDEFYTQYSDISNELGHYRQHLKDAVVYCNCDDPSWSNFWRYFHNNFASLGLKKLICTHYQKDTEPSYALIYDGGDDFNMDAGDTVTIYGNTTVVDGKEVFYTAGDFRSDACIRFLKEADIVCTNPMFSLFRQYLKQLIDYNKKFIILGNQNAATYKEVFPLIKENKVWYGASIHSGGVDFRMPDDYETYSKNVFLKDGHHYINLSGIRWFTNLDVSYRHDGLWHLNGKFDNTQAHCYYEGHEDKYPKYDNYDAIEVSKTKDIPIDYAGIMGVPITWLDKYSPEEFEIVGADEAEGTGFSNGLFVTGSKHKQCFLNGKRIYKRIFIRNRNPIAKKDDLGY